MKKIILILCAFVSAICVSAKVGDIFTSGNITYKVTSENDNVNEVAVQSPQSTDASFSLCMRWMKRLRNTIIRHLILFRLPRQFMMLS